MDFTQILLALIAILIAVCYYKYKRKYSFWSDRGVSGPRPWPLFGTSYDVIFRKTLWQADADNTKKYGKVFGFYDGNEPALMVADRAIIEQIYVQHFATFPLTVVTGSDDPIDNSSTVVQHGADWKRARSALSTLFTSSKLRAFVPAINDSLINLMKVLEQHARDKQDFRLEHYLSLSLLEMTGKVFYSIDVDVFADPNGAYVQSAKKIFDFSTLTILLLTNLPAWAIKLLGIGSMQNEYFQNFIKHAISSRKDTEVKNDMVQLLVQERAKNDSDASRGLKDIEVLANGIVFFGASFDTTKSTATCFLWRMAMHTDIQERVYREIAEMLADKARDELTYDDYVKLEYMEAAINETLRLTPVDARAARIPITDTTVPLTDIHIPAGTSIYFPAQVVHTDPENFEDPWRFNPDRFLPEHRAAIKAGSFIAFGAGPRQCVGQRFAYVSLKAMLVEIIRNYVVCRSPNTVAEITSTVGQFMIDVTNVVVRFEKRN